MTSLSNLSVSLTKHGAHKIATLLKKTAAETLLNHLDGSIETVNIDRTQAQKNLSAENGRVPAIWGRVQKLGDSAIDSLVLLAIVFSHNKLIDVMLRSSTGYKVGTITRGVHLTGKEFTNFSHTLDQLGFVTAQSYKEVSYDLSNLFVVQFGPLAEAIIEHKLTTAGWGRSNLVADEAVRLGFHKALSIPESEFRSWLKGPLYTASVTVASLPVEDEEFFASASDAPVVSSFKFTPGHTPRVEGSIDIKAPANKVTAEFLHNKIQNSLYTFLENSHGKGCVGTEVGTGDGTSIDVVLKKGRSFWFYEIKTALSVKASIRQALPQLLEYAYWPDVTKAERLIIVSHLPAKPITESYLKTLRERFGIPIYYQCFCLDSNTLINNL